MLSVRVTLVRNKTKILLGDGGNSELMLAIRRFGNFAEYGPLGLLLLVLVSVQAETWFVDAAGIALVAGRAIHPFGITAKPAPADPAPDRPVADLDHDRRDLDLSAGAGGRVNR